MRNHVIQNAEIFLFFRIGLPAERRHQDAELTLVLLAYNSGLVAKDQIARFGVSLSRALLNQLDRMVQKKGYRNRSLAISDMIRDHLVGHQQEIGDSEMAGTITIVYNHHRPHVQETLTDLQHKHLDAIISTLHVHLDHDNCLEVLVVRGKGAVVRSVADHLIAVRGVKHGRLTMTTTGKDLPE